MAQEGQWGFVHDELFEPPTVHNSQWGFVSTQLFSPDPPNDGQWGTVVYKLRLSHVPIAVMTSEGLKYLDID